jgi:hypothetical protein
VKYATWIAAAAFLAIAMVTPLGRRTVAAFRPVTAESASLAAKAMSLDDGRPDLILLYSTGSPASRELFPAFVELSQRALDQGANVFVYSTDDGLAGWMVGPYLASHDAPFEARRIVASDPGELKRELTAIGIGVGPGWVSPLVAVRARDGHLAYQQQGVRDLGPASAALLEALHSKR